MKELIDDAPIAAGQAAVAAPSGSPSRNGHRSWELNPRTLHQIGCKAGQLIGKAGFTAQDRKDLEQELTAMLLARLDGFDARRATQRTFVSRLLDRFAATILKAREAAMRDWRQSVRSLSEFVTDEDGEPIELVELLEKEGDLPDCNSKRRSPHEALALRLDLEAVMERLPDREREACLLLLQLRPEDARRQMGMTHASFYDLRRRVRKAFEAAGLKKYL